ncbi:MAG: hypothetical protein JJ878_04335 [Alphaproteobacteria bacterium]|nr:hypothetical protein [Alphaproteobacteria bacterium]
MRSYRPLIRAGFLAALMSSVAVPVAWAQDAVRIRAWQHSDFARIVFDWPSAVGYSAAIDGQVLTIRFDRALTVDLAPIRERLGDYIAQATAAPGGQSLTFQLTGPMSLGDFTNENSIVVDLRQAATVTEQAPSTAPSAPSSSAQAAPQVAVPAPAEAIPLSVRVGEHPNYTRIVFDWPNATTYSVDRDGRAVTVDFGRAARIDVAALGESLPPGIRVAAAVPSTDRTVITFAVPAAAELRHFPLEEKVVLDVLADARIRNVAAEPLAVAQLPQAPQPASPAPETTAPPEPSAPTTPESTEAPRQQLPEAQQEARSQAALAEALQEGTIEFRDGMTPDVPNVPPPPGPAPTEQSAAEPTQRDPIPPPASEATTQSDQPVAETAAAPAAAPQEDIGPPLFDYTFKWDQNVGAAVFRRADNIWIVFDASRPIDLAELRATGAPIVERVDQLPVSGATVLRAQVSDRKVNVRVRREGFTWVVDFVNAPLRPFSQAPIAADVTSEIGPHLLFPSDDPGAALNVPDPEMGDVMRVATFHESGSGVDGLRRYPEFELLPSAQGLAMVRLSDTVLLDRNFDGYQISDPDGLAITAIAPEAPIASGPILSARRLFDLAGLMRGSQAEFQQSQRALVQSLSEVPDEKINTARLDFAGFMMAHDRGQEALGVLRVVEKSDSQLMQRPENQALHAAAAVLAGRSEQARGLLNDPRLDGFAEAAIWRGAALAQEGLYGPASDAFGPGDSLLMRYPFPLKARIGLLRIETAFANKNLHGAEAWIDQLELDRGALTKGQQAALDYHRGRLAVAKTDFTLAEEIFKEVMASGDRKYAYQAELAWIRLGLRQGLMDDDEALERMERLRYAWRGDRTELYLLRSLGELYLRQPNYFEGLDVYRTAVKYFPGDPVAEDLAGEMTEVFKQLFLEGGVDDLAPLRALALYEEFKELTPAGVAGDRLIENIADRLAAIDLLEEAAEKLEELLADENRLPPGEERVRLSSKLALIYLLDDEPRKAEEALAKGGGDLDFLEIDPGLRADRDRLRARAKFQLGSYDEAIKELAGDVSLEADMLRRDIYRQTENWQESAKVLQRLAGNPPADPAEGIEGQPARYVVNWAVALYQNNDRDGLRDLVDLWGPTMANSSLSGVFDYITNQERPPTGGDVLQTVDQLIGAQRFDNFLTEYRDRLFAPPEPPNVQVSAS